MGTRWDDITDPSNPFTTTGISDEVKALLDYLVAAKHTTGVDVVAVSTVDHPVLANSGNRSRHRQPGTNGLGLALDCRLRARGYNTHMPVFGLFLPVTSRLHELIHAAAPKNIRSGKWVAPYAVADHHDHVHVSVDRGVLLHFPHPAPIKAPIVLEEDKLPDVIVRPQGGYIVVAGDGGVFTGPDTPYLGSLPEINVRPSAPVVGGAWTPSGNGYWLVAADGALYAFGDAVPILGSNVDPLRSAVGNRTVVGLRCIDAKTVEIVAFDPSNDGSPYDGYQASAG